MNKAELAKILINSSDKSVSELSDLMGVSRFIIHKWKTGKSNPRKQNLNYLAKINNVKIKWISELNVEIIDSISVSDDDSKISLSTYNEVISNQSDLINRLRNDLLRLQNNTRKFRQSRNIVKNHDYSIKASIDPFEVLEVYNIPNDGLLGYSKKEFAFNVKLFLDNPMIDESFRKSMVDDIIERCAHASDLQLEHFDLTDYVEVIHKNKKIKSWICYVGYYDLTSNECVYYARILDNLNSSDHDSLD